MYYSKVQQLHNNSNQSSGFSFCFHQLNGDQIQDENIAEYDGLKEAFFVCLSIFRFQTYQKWAQIHLNIDKKLPDQSNATVNKCTL
jgi:hypothetical protein